MTNLIHGRQQLLRIVQQASIVFIHLGLPAPSVNGGQVITVPQLIGKFHTKWSIIIRVVVARIDGVHGLSLHWEKCVSDL